MQGEVQFEGGELSISATVLLVTTQDQVQLFIPTATVIIMVTKEAIASTLSTVNSTVMVAAFIATMM
jgi:hypothetical protein